MDDAQSLINMLEADNQDIGYDTETNGLSWKKCTICGYGASDGDNSFYVPVRHGGGGNIADPTGFENSLARAIKKRKKKLIAHNTKFDMHFSENHGVILGNKVRDTMVNAAILNEHRYSYSLDNVCKSYPDIAQKSGKDLYIHMAGIFGGKPTARDQMGNFWRLSGEDEVAVSYAKQDNVAVKQLYTAQERELVSEELERVQSMEEELTYILQKMERRGIRIDLDAAAKLKEQTEIDRLEAYSHIPLTEDLDTINVKSRLDLQKYFEYCGIQDWPLTEKGNPSFNKLFLKQSTEGELILDARKLDFFTSTFLNPLDDHIHNGRIHTRFNQAVGEFGYSSDISGVKFGRLSSADPNMQQVPKRDKNLGRKFRKIFIADEGFVFVELDYSQAEPRLFTHYSKEPTLLNGYNSTPFIDMHSVAAELMGLNDKHGRDPEGLEAARGVAKNLNLGIMYTMGAALLANQLGISLYDARAIMKLWYKAFPKGSSFTKSASQVAEARGYVKTILGRRARFPDPRWAYRAANRIIQGGSADVLKWKMVELNRWIEASGYDDKVQLILNIHDSLLIQVRKDSLHLIKEVQAIMENVQGPPFSLTVPFVVDYKPAAANWSDATYGIYTPQALAA